VCLAPHIAIQFIYLPHSEVNDNCLQYVFSKSPEMIQWMVKTTSTNDEWHCLHFNFVKYILIYDDKHVYYIMILFKQFYCLSCCHLTFRKIWYCLIKTRIDLVSLSFSNEIYKRNLFHFNVIKQLQSFCFGQYEFLWTLKINIHLSLKASVNIVFKVHKNSYWPQQKTIQNIIV
jgi:hypothetical protein